MNPNMVIVGLGKTGLSCVRYLARENIPLAIMDSRQDPPGLVEVKQEFPNIPIHLGSFNVDWLQNAKVMIVSPGISLREPAIADAIAKGVPALGDIELFARDAKNPVIGITGTNGKSTVTSLVGEMAKAAGKKVAVGGNLGTPALDLLREQPNANLFVLELSSFQLETTYSLKTLTASVLNITPDHMDRYRDLNEYIAAKQRIYQQCQHPVINRENKLSYSGLNSCNDALSFGLDEPEAGQFGLRQQNAKTYLAYGQENILDVAELIIKGRHQWANALAALALGTATGFPLAIMLQTLRTFPGLRHRCQWIATIDNVAWYNDSKGTNVSSSLAGIAGLGDTIHGKLILIAGGLGKQQDFSPLREPVAKFARAVILMGQDAPLIEKALQGATKVLHASDLSNAVKMAQQTAQAGDAVLLSPACASYDMFKNFEHRGDVFIDAVQALVK